MTAIALALWCALALTTEAACVDVVRPDELPDQVEIPGGTTISYTYDLESERYFVSWASGDQAGGPLGPFVLQRSCTPATVAHVSDAFFVLEGGCGTSCWYFHIFSLPAAGKSSVGLYATIDRPLAFDSSRSLVAYYRTQDRIAIRNLITGYEQEVPTPHDCDTSSGLCFGAVRFSHQTLEYAWHSNMVDDEVIHEQLDEALVKQ